MSVTVYSSTDLSAPVLNGTLGTLLGVLDACLVNGYGSKVAAGWSKAFSGTNKAAYRAGGGTQCYLRVDDSAPGAAGTREARACGYGTMTSVDAGTEQFPTAAQLSVSIPLRKSTSSDSTAREWMVIADDQGFYLFTKPGEFTLTSWTAFWFGDTISFRPDSDPYSCAIVGRSAENATVESSENFTLANYSPASSPQAGHYIERSHDGMGGSLQMGLMGNYTHNTGARLGQTPNTTGTNPVNLGVYLCRTYIQYSSAVRGMMPGLWTCGNLNVFNDGDTLSGLVGLPGRSFICLQILGVANASKLLFETSDTWRT